MREDTLAPFVGNAVTALLFLAALKFAIFLSSVLFTMNNGPINQSKSLLKSSPFR